MQWIIDFITGIINALYEITVAVGFPSYALAIIMISVILKLVLYPLTVKQLKSTQGIQEIQPKMTYLQNKYKNDKEKLNQEVMKLYTEYNINPMAGCLPLLIQMPIIFGLFSALRAYQFTPLEHATFFWVPNLNNPDPVFILPVLVGLSMFAQQKITMPSSGPGADNPTMKMMLYIMPVMIGFMSIQFPSGLCVYWITFSILGAIQQLFLNKKRKKELAIKAEKEAIEKEERLKTREEAKAKGQAPGKKKKRPVSEGKEKKEDTTGENDSTVNLSKKEK